MPCRTAACSQNTDLSRASFVQVTASIRIPGSRNFGLEGVFSRAGKSRTVIAADASLTIAVTERGESPGRRRVRLRTPRRWDRMRQGTTLASEFELARAQSYQVVVDRSIIPRLASASLWCVFSFDHLVE